MALRGVPRPGARRSATPTPSRAIWRVSPIRSGAPTPASSGIVGAPAPWGGLRLAHGVSQVVAVMAIAPGGLGAVEGSLTVVLVAYGAARGPALAAALVHRRG